MDIYQILILVTALISQLISIFGAFFISWRFNHNNKKYVKEQISCKKREIWDIQKQLTTIVCSGDKKVLKSAYVSQLVERLKKLKREISELNAQLKPKDKDTTKLNVTEITEMVNQTLKTITKEK